MRPLYGQFPPRFRKITKRTCVIERKAPLAQGTCGRGAVSAEPENYLLAARVLRAPPRPYSRAPALPSEIAPRWGRGALGCRLTINGRRSPQSGAPPTGFFLVLVPGTQFRSRKENDVRSFDGTDKSGQARAELRLRVLHSLPPKHQRYL